MQTKGTRPIKTVEPIEPARSLAAFFDPRSHGFPIRGLACGLVLFLLAACDGRPWNNPFAKADDKANIAYAAFQERPKHLDPARSYSSNEYELIAQIYEPPLQYHFLRRPYELVPLTALQVPQPVYWNAQGEIVDENDPAVAYSVYDIQIKRGIQYQPHAAFAKDNQGRYLYHSLSPAEVAEKNHLSDFEETGSREVTADDYVYEIKRLAHPGFSSPILSVMTEYIDGLDQLAKTLAADYTQLKAQAEQQGLNTEQLYMDLRKYDLSGAQVLDRYTYRIKIKGKYPQILYWLAMPFFSPMAWEADRFFSQQGMEQKNLNLHWYPVGSGAYMLTENNPNRRMVLERNPNFHGELYPKEGDPEDASNGLLHDAGKNLPFVDKVVFVLEKETIPYWNKFLQGYYDNAGVNAESFDQVIQFGSHGEIGLSEEMQQKGIGLATAVMATTFYMGFNMNDPVVGGLDERARKLRQAISIAVDYEEYIAIFLNGRGIAAQSPIPPGIFGYHEGESGINTYVYDWVDGRAQRKPIAYAKKLMREAGYGDGIEQATGKPLVLYLDGVEQGAEGKTNLDWMRKQFQKIDIQLVFRLTQYNRFQQKMQNGSAQIYQWGWNADYPDPENFLFLLYGPNGKVKYQGENASNYTNPQFDALFVQMKNMVSGPQRLKIIDQMLEIARRDAPWLWGHHPKSYSLYHQWVHNVKPHVIANNTLKYKRIDPDLRDARRREWNQPTTWPVWLTLFVFVLGTLPAVITFWRREHKPRPALKEKETA